MGNPYSKDDGRAAGRVELIEPREMYLKRFHRLQKGKWYVFDHKTKARFRAKFLGTVPMDGDPTDRFFLSVVMDTSAETGNVRLARAKGPDGTWPKLTTANLRPSKILSFQAIETTN